METNTYISMQLEYLVVILKIIPFKDSFDYLDDVWTKTGLNIFVCLFICLDDLNRVKNSYIFDNLSCVNRKRSFLCTLEISCISKSLVVFKKYEKSEFVFKKFKKNLLTMNNNSCNN